MTVFAHCPKIKFSIKGFFSKCDQVRRKLHFGKHVYFFYDYGCTYLNTVVFLWGNWSKKLIFFGQQFKWVLYVYCAAFATIVRQWKASFTILCFPNILSKHKPIFTKFWALVSGYIYDIGTKDQLNTNITSEVIISLSHI